MRFAPGSAFSIEVGSRGTNAKSLFSCIALKFQGSFRSRRNACCGLLANHIFLTTNSQINVTGQH